MINIEVDLKALLPCDGKVKDIYKSKELWRGPESIYRKEVVLALSGDTFSVDLSSKFTSLLAFATFAASL